MYSGGFWTCLVEATWNKQSHLEHVGACRSGGLPVSTHSLNDEPHRELDPYVVGTGFLDRLSEGVILLNFEGKVVDCNAKACAILDRESVQMIGKGLDETDWHFVHEDGAPMPRSENPIEITLHTGVGCRDTMVGLDAPRKARRWVKVSTTPLTHEDGIKGVIATLDDVTSLKHEERSLRLLLEVSRLLTSMKNESEFLQRLCDTLVEVGGYAIARLDCAIDDDERSVKTMYISNFTDRFTQSVYSWSDSAPDGSRRHCVEDTHDASGR